MKRWTILIISLWLLAACNTPTTTTTNYALTPNAPATLAAAELARQQAANAATVQAAELERQVVMATQQAAQATQAVEGIMTGTAQSIAYGQTATSEGIALRVTEQAIQIQSTRESIAASATGTAVAQIALAEQRLIEDEQQRLALQREAEAAAIDYQRTMNRLKPFLWGGLVLVLLIGVIALACFLYQLSRPITVTDVSGPRVLIPANNWRVLPQPSPSRPLALPAPGNDESPTPAPRALIPLPPLTEGHVLIAGETGSGKTTAMLAVLRRRANVVVLDPHDDQHTWGQAQVIGGGRDFAAIGDYMVQMQRLLSERYNLRSQGQREFESLTVATDEMPAIIAALGRDVDETWRMWLREGRKVRLFFVVSTQSTRVKTLGIRGEGDLLENFSYIIALGKLAVKDYPDLVQGMARPAVIRTLDGVRPVLIQAERPLLSPTSSNPIFIAPAPGSDHDEGYADPNNLTETTRARIRRLAQQLPSQAAIERAVFGYNGGAAYRAVKQVLNGSTTDENT